MPKWDCPGSGVAERHERRRAVRGRVGLLHAAPLHIQLVLGVGGTFLFTKMKQQRNSQKRNYAGCHGLFGAPKVATE